MLKAVAVAILVGAVVASGAVAAEAPTREEYVERLEAICKPGAEATQRAMKGARADVKEERLRVAAGKFAKATSIFGSTVKRISAVTRPAADKAKLKKWFGYLKIQQSYLTRMTAQLRAGHAARAQRLFPHFLHNGNLANNVVLAFGFNYCSFKISRYG